MSDLKSKIIESLREVYDPEIPINVYDLGLIYEINVKKNGDVDAVMTLTSPTCPTADYLQEIIKQSIEDVKGVKKVSLKLTFDPPWTPDRVSMEAKEELGLADQSDPAIEHVFESENKCFKCGITDNQVPLVEVMYKQKKELICHKCLSTFSS